MLQFSSTVKSINYTTTAFMLASGHPGLEIQILYCIEYCTAKNTKAQFLVRDACMWQCTTNYLTWFDMWMHIFIFEILKLEGLYVGDLLYTRDLYYFLWLLVTVQFSQLKTRWNSYSYSPSLWTSWFYHSHADSVWTSVFTFSVVLIKVKFYNFTLPPKKHMCT